MIANRQGLITVAEKHDLLSGLRVVDLTLAAVGPFCARILRDLGAEVTHIEWPRVRWEGAQSGREASRFCRKSDGQFGRETELFMHTNAGKRSLAVNLKTTAGLKLMTKMLEHTDVVIENMTPRVMRGFGLDYESVAKINPGIIMCSLTGFGQAGLDGDTARPCTDPVAQAMSGLSWITGERDGPPFAIGGGLGDTATSVLGAVSILAALTARARTGAGQYIDMSMVESLAYLDCTALPATVANGRSRLFRNGQQNSYTFPMGPFRATGGYIAIQAPGAGSESPWGRLCSLMDTEWMITDPRFATDESRLDHPTEVITAVESWLCSMEDREAALTLLATERISAGPVLSQDEMLEHRFFQGRNTFGTVRYPELGDITVVEPPFKFSEAAAYVRGPAPEMGEHTRRIAEEECGLTPTEIDELIEAGVLYESAGAQSRHANAVENTGRIA